MSSICCQEFLKSIYKNGQTYMYTQPSINIPTTLESDITRNQFSESKGQRQTPVHLSALFPTTQRGFP